MAVASVEGVEVDCDVLEIGHESEMPPVGHKVAWGRRRSAKMQASMAFVPVRTAMVSETPGRPSTARVSLDQ